MAKGTRGRRGISSRQCRSKPHPFKPRHHKAKGLLRTKRCSKHCKRDWEDATCSVCMEYPHNAVLLLCSSHENGCRPYMCGTSFRYSNCLDQFKNAHAKATSATAGSLLAELACPLCRGKVKGWTVVEPAREHLNGKKRSCMQENCAFAGTFRELRKHVKAEHPSAKPREVDPSVEHKWRRMEREREREDVISTIRSSMPGAVFFGDYVIEGGQGQHRYFDSDDDEGFVDGNGVMNRGDGGVRVGVDGNLMSMFLFLQAFGNNNLGSNRDGVGVNRGGERDDFSSDSESSGGDGEAGNEDRALVGLSRGPRRRREINGGQR